MSDRPDVVGGSERVARAVGLGLILGAVLVLLGRVADARR